MKGSQAIRIGLLGLGTVGSGVVKVLHANRAQIEAKVGAPLELKWVADKSPARKKFARQYGLDLVPDASTILNDPQVDVVIELIGGKEPARTFILEALRSGKHVVTANKALLARHWDEIISTAEKSGSEIYIEASVGGGIPIIQALNDGLPANRIERIYAIINGTCNYILTRMAKDGIGFQEALAEAQKNGFAEANPKEDVEGHDTANKLAILASLAFDKTVHLRDIHTEGITRITAQDIIYAREEFDSVIKLLAIAKEVKDELEVRVHPTLISNTHLLAGVDGVFNGIYVIGDAVGPTMYYGKGAGQMPTASAVLSDVISIARNIVLGIAGRTPGFRHTATSQRSRRIKGMDQVRSRYYLRFTAMDKPGVLAGIAQVLGDHHISIASVVQKERREGNKVPVVIMTYGALEKDVRLALSRIDRLPVIKAKTMLIRVEKGD